MSLQYFEEKNIFLSKCLFIFLSQYCVQKCLVCISPKNLNLNLDEVISSEDLKQQTVKSSSQSCRPSLKHKNSVRTSQKSSKK